MIKGDVLERCVSKLLCVCKDIFPFFFLLFVRMFIFVYLQNAILRKVVAAAAAAAASLLLPTVAISAHQWTNDSVATQFGAHYVYATWAQCQSERATAIATAATDERAGWPYPMR